VRSFPSGVKLPCTSVLAYLLSEVVGESDRAVVALPSESNLSLLAQDLQALGVKSSSLPVLDPLSFSEASARRTLSAFDGWLSEGGVLVVHSPLLASSFEVEGPSSSFVVEVGRALDLRSFVEFLESSGFKRVSMVVGPGEWARRGGILDVFPFEGEHPVRVELDGESVDRVALFDPVTQRSTRRLSVVQISSYGEAKTFSPGTSLEGVPLVLVDPNRSRAALFEAAEALESRLLRLDPRRLEALSSSAVLCHLDEMEGDASWVFERGIRVLEPFKGDVGRASKAVELWLRDGFEVLLFLEEDVPELSGLAARRVSSHISQGFLDLSKRRVFLGEGDVFGYRGLARRAGSSSRSRLSPELPSEGDLVVHADYGIGRFLGLERIEGKDYLKIEYRDSKILFVPLHLAYKVDRYVGPAGREEVELDELGGRSRWEKARRKAARAAFRRAMDLHRLYAERKSRYREPFGGDPDMERLLELSFPYRETADQLKALEEVLGDLSRPYPMDRLLCGDAGVGKTEVALRAAMRVVASGKQVAVLVPTTLLAAQHFKLFRERLEPLGVRVEMLSRLVPPPRAARVVEGLREGWVDLVVGTHSLLGKRVSFKRLGLLVVDEEHKFGVAQKEELRRLREGLDVLSISATPIPRTLGLALGGMKDMSVISTPPVGRREVWTYVGPFSWDLAVKAIRRELQRGGQAFVVRNRIEGLEEVAMGLSCRMPGLRLGLAHGRMGPSESEEVVSSFARGELDVLISTAIVESGLDFPNANTIVVLDSHLLGLPQMYHLRGRVGRGDRQAFAYFTYPEGVGLSEGASMRLEAISGTSAWGGGYHLALRDLEIRGAGELFGLKQHGDAERVGLKLYLDLLGEALRRARGEGELPELSAPALLEGLDLYIPSDQLRFAFFKVLWELEGVEEVLDLEEELRDRFGPPPWGVRLLLGLQALRLSLRGVVRRMVLERGSLRLFPEDPVGAGPLLERMGAKRFGRAWTLEVSSLGFEGLVGAARSLRRPKGEGLGAAAA